MEKIEISKFHDESTEIKSTVMNEASNTQTVIEFEEEDEDGNETAFKEVIRVFREPDTRRYLPKQAYLKIVVHAADPDDDTKINVYQVGGIAKIDVSKYVNTKDEPVSFIFKPN